jgi:hypothetical protein
MRGCPTAPEWRMAQPEIARTQPPFSALAGIFKANITILPFCFLFLQIF